MYTKISMLVSLLFCGFMLLCHVDPVSGQDNFYGTLKESETGVNISNATIKYSDGKGVISDNQGNFKIENPSFPIRLEISHIGYQSKVVIIKSIHETGMIIPLEITSVNINQIEVIGGKIIRLFPNTYFYMIDYAFVDNKILIIGYDRSRLNHGKLILTNLSQDTLFSISIEKPKNLYKDGFGNIHLFTGDSVYQLFVKGNEVELLYPTKREFFPDDLLNFQFQIGKHFFFKELAGEGQVNKYYAIDTVSRRVVPLRTIYIVDLFSSEEEAMRYIQWIPMWEKKMDSSLAVVLEARREMESYMYDINVTHKPINSRIFKVGNRAVIVNLANQKTIQFDQNLEEVSSVKNELPQHHKIQKLIIQDPITEKLYWVNYVGTKVTLLELDIDTGKVKTTLETPNLPFIENVKIYNGTIWFLYQPRLGETVQSLYRMNI